MLSRIFFRTFSLLLPLGQNFCSCNISLDSQTRVFKILKNPKVNGKLVRNNNLIWFWSLAALGIVAKLYLTGQTLRCKLTTFCWITGISVTILHLLMRCISDDFCRAINAFVGLFKYLHEKYLPGFEADSSRLSQVADILVLVNCFVWTAGIVLMCMFCAYDPKAVIFLGELVPHQYYSYFPFGIAIAVFHIYLMICLGICVCIMSTFLIVYLFYVTAFYTAELPRGLKEYRTSNNLRGNPENLRHTFRCFQLLNTHVMQFSGPCINYFHCAYLVLPVLGNYLLIKYWCDMSTLEICIVFLIAEGVTMYWTAVLQLGKYLHVKGEKLIWSWKGMWCDSLMESKLMRKFTKSCTLVLIRNGKMLVVKRLTQFIYFKGVSRGVLRSLLALR